MSAESDSTLHQLYKISTELRQLSAFLVPVSGQLGEENVNYVVETAAAMEAEFSQLINADHAVDPLESKEFRHDLRNQIAIIKGFSDLMRMDLNGTCEISQVLDRLIGSSNDFVIGLDRAREGQGAEDGAAIFA